MKKQKRAYELEQQRLEQERIELLQKVEKEVAENARSEKHIELLKHIVVAAQRRCDAGMESKKMAESKLESIRMEISACLEVQQNGGSVGGSSFLRILMKALVSCIPYAEHAVA